MSTAGTDTAQLTAKDALVAFLVPIEVDSPEWRGISDFLAYSEAAYNVDILNTGFIAPTAAELAEAYARREAINETMRREERSSTREQYMQTYNLFEREVLIRHYRGESIDRLGFPQGPITVGGERPRTVQEKAYLHEWATIKKDSAAAARRDMESLLKDRVLSSRSL